MTKKIINVLLYPAVFAVFVALGLYAGPYARAAYEKLFPAADFVEGDYSQVLKAGNAEVVLFSTSTCPYCTQTRALLDSKGVRYKDFVLDKSSDGEAIYRTLNEKAVPVLIIGQRKITGYRPETITNALSVTQSG